MSRSRPRGARAALLGPFIGLALVLGLLAGCSDDGASLLGDGSTPSPSDTQHVLDDRAEAIRAGDLSEFLKSLDTTDTRLVNRQRRYFANVQRLPLETFEYDVLKSDWPAGLRAPSWGKEVSMPQVRVSTQLEGFDTVPVRRVTGFAFAHKHGRTVIVSE